MGAGVRHVVGRCLLTAWAWFLANSPACGQGFSPEEALKRMKAPDGFRVRLVAAEPFVRQPVAIDFDDRGRLWVIQYLQYPNPAGLKRVKVDRFSRTVYDRVPEPPPRGPKGADRVTILEDTDGDGRADRAKDFVNGLNLASGFAFGHGGVFVLHGVQGGYYWKLFGKHGALHNPHAYGYFDHAPHRSPRGGHVTVGGIVYRGDSCHDRFRDKYIAGVLLGHNVYWNDIEP